MSYSGGPENLTNSHTDEFNYPIYGINAGTSSITFSGDDASSTGSKWQTSFFDLLMSGSSTNSQISGSSQNHFNGGTGWINPFDVLQITVSNINPANGGSLSLMYDVDDDAYLTTYGANGSTTIYNSAVDGNNGTYTFTMRVPFLDLYGNSVSTVNPDLSFEVVNYNNANTSYTITIKDLGGGSFNGGGGGQSPPPPPPPSPPPPTEVSYIGPNGGDFGNPAYWSGGAVPGSSMRADIGVGGGVTVNSSGVYEVSSLDLGANCTFNINSGGFVADNFIDNERTATINVSGSLQANPFRSGAYIINYGTIIITIPSGSLTAPTGTNLGNMVAHGGLIDFDPLTNSGTMSADSGGKISVTGATVDNGSITANSGGTVYLGGQVYSNGSFVAGSPLNVNGGNIILGSADSEPVYFQSGGQLTIDQPTAFGGTIVFAGNPANDVIDLPGTTVTDVYNTGSSLILTESN